MAIALTAPTLVRLPFMSQEDTPAKELWQYCTKIHEWWKTDLSLNEEIARCMREFRRQKAFNLVWCSKKLEGTLPKELSQLDTFKLLGSLYDQHIGDTPEMQQVDLGGRDAESDRKSRRQLIQHMMAYKHLCEPAAGETKPLSEDLVKGTHKILMDGLTSEDGSPLHSGEYRLIRVHAGDHAFPDSDCVPDGMARIVAKYNSKAAVPHDPFQLASWLLYQVVSLHPFEDGNGRMCRLLWCYSLMRDGLPFPLTISSGHSKAHKHYVRAIERSHCSMYQTSDYPHLTTLTVVSVQRAWCNFFCNLQFELPTVYAKYASRSWIE